MLWILHPQLARHRVLQVSLKPGGTEYSAQLIGVDQDKDIAVLQIALDAQVCCLAVHSCTA